MIIYKSDSIHQALTKLAMSKVIPFKSSVPFAVSSKITARGELLKKLPRLRQDKANIEVVLKGMGEGPASANMRERLASINKILAPYDKSSDMSRIMKFKGRKQ